MRIFIIFIVLLVLGLSNVISQVTPNKSLIKEKVIHPIFLNEELPADFPKITIDSLNNPSPGYIFMESITIGGKTANYLMVLDSSGKVVKYIKPEAPSLDFKMQQNGLITYGSQVKLGDKYQAGPLTVQNIMVRQNILDAAYNLIDTVQMKNEYLADIHDFQILPNGNYVMIAYEGFPIDMSKIVPGGNPNATVVGTVIQELDINKKCVFQWRSLDYIPILATKDDPRKATFEHVHGNSVFLDKDGNMILSFPTTFEIVKIDMTTGRLIWRFGGDKNEFEITGDNPVDAPYYFRMQHDAHKLDNGNMLFYDNAVQKKSGWSSRAVEYEFDELNKKAKLVWDFKHTPAISAYAMGSAQRLKNGNTLIDWGLIFTGFYRTITEVTSDKKTVFELSIPADAFSYRAHKYDLPPCKPDADIDKYEMLKGNTYKFNNEDIETGVTIYFEDLDAFIYNTVNVKRISCSPLYPYFEGEAPVLLNCRYWITPQLIYSFSGEVRFDLSYLPPHTNPENLVVYYRSKLDSGMFIPLETNFDISENQLVAKTDEFGEFVIGYVRQSTEIDPPKPMFPLDNKVLLNDKPVRIVWTSTGRYDNFQLQISDRPDFSTLVVDSVGIETPIFNDLTLEPNAKYYWRSRTFYRNLTSDWSTVRTFSIGSAFMTMVYPIGNETLTKDSTYIVKWSTNLTDSVSITLLKNGVKELSINDGFVSHSNSFAWKIPKTLEEGDFYKIKITNIKDGSMIAESDNTFKIGNPVGVEDNEQTISNTIDIFPNPVNDFTSIEITTKESKFTKLAIYDNLGREIKVLYNSFLESGIYRLNLNTSDLQDGFYHCILNDGEKSVSKSLIIIK